MRSARVALSISIDALATGFCHLCWRRAEQRGLIRNQAGGLLLTERGRQMARQSLLATTSADLTFVEGNR